LNLGDYTVSVTFTPIDAMNYEPAKATVSISVVRQNPAEIAWSAPQKIPYGTPLSDAQLNATASVPGTFAYGPCAGNLLPAGGHTLS
ncbi:hypothetical protein, partial [Escherichia coli]|uniref:hypothetical protein n=1 Tax=Escherichia coli TaxID=562 RepID=UPI003F44BC2D